MTSLARCLLVGLGLVWTATALAAIPEHPAPPGVVLSPAEPGAVEELLAESGVESTPPKPRFREYIGLLGQRAAAWLGDLLAVPLIALARVGLSLPILLMALVAILLAVILYYLARAIWRQRSGRRQLAQDGEVESSLESTAVDESTSAEQWRRRLERELAAGNAAAAARALWWWLACTLAGAEVDSSWSSRDLLRRTGARSVRPALGRLDRMLYGPVRPTVDQVQDLTRELREVRP